MLMFSRNIGLLHDTHIDRDFRTNSLDFLFQFLILHISKAGASWEDVTRNRMRFMFFWRCRTSYNQTKEQMKSWYCKCTLMLLGLTKCTLMLLGLTLWVLTWWLRWGAWWWTDICNLSIVARNVKGFLFPLSTINSIFCGKTWWCFFATTRIKDQNLHPRTIVLEYQKVQLLQAMGTNKQLPSRLKH